jgi:hypothetical protein
MAPFLMAAFLGDEQKSVPAKHADNIVRGAGRKNARSRHADLEKFGVALK